MADPEGRGGRGGASGANKRDAAPGATANAAITGPPEVDEARAREEEARIEERRRALRDLKAIDEETLAGVFDALADDDPGVRREAIRLIGRSAPTPGLLLALERALTDDRELGRRSAAMDSLAAMGKPALALLSRLAVDPRAGVRRLAVDALGISRVPEALDVLEKSARDPQAAVRSAALEAVARTGAARAGAVLVRAVEDRNEQPAVVLAALLGLLQLNKLPSAHTLRRLAEDALTAPPALRLLGRAGEVGFLVDALVTTTGSRRRAAALGLAEALDQNPRPPPRLTEPDVVEALRGLVESADVVVASAALVVAAYAGDPAPILLAAARDDRGHLSSAAHRAVAVLDSRGVELVARFRAVITDDLPGADLLIELIEALERGKRGAPTPAGKAHLDERSFARLARLVEQTAGIAVTDDARVRLESRLLPRLDETRLKDFATYVELIAGPTGRSKDELQRALELITVHETYFFREKAQLDAFRDDVIPPLKQKSESNTNEVVRLWSAGTSSGEEAYTLAILLEEAGIERFEVVGTDLSSEALESARGGKYMPRSFRGEIDGALRKRWFIYEIGGVQVHPSLKKSVRFEVKNLLDDLALASLPGFDVIFCRNVLIYMSPQARARVIDAFWRKLKPGGVLLLGHSESLLHIDTPFRLKPLRRGLAYEKPSDSSS